jgi:hypothetical protein
MSEQKDTPRFQLATETRIDLKIIQQQLDEVESALLMAWQHSTRIGMTEQDQQLSNAIDALLAVKR